MRKRNVERIPGRQVISLNGFWYIAKDLQDNGKQAEWYKRGPVRGAVKTQVPGCLEEVFPNTDGIVWYWKKFKLRQLQSGKRVKLKFGAVNYYAEVWLNGYYIGANESGTLPFMFDVTDTLRRGTNKLVVRVIDVCEKRIDGFVLSEVPAGRERTEMPGGTRFYNYGGIWQSVKLIILSPQWISDVFIQPDTLKERIKIDIELTNEDRVKKIYLIDFAIYPSKRKPGNPVSTKKIKQRLTYGKTQLKVDIPIYKPKLWNLDVPYLYRLVVKLKYKNKVVDQWSDRFGMREFTYQNGKFHLNGKSLLIKVFLYNALYPISLAYPSDGIARRDIELVKEANCNMLRAFCKPLTQNVLDIADELGVLIYEEAAA